MALMETFYLSQLSPFNLQPIFIQNSTCHLRLRYFAATNYIYGKKVTLVCSNNFFLVYHLCFLDFFFFYRNKKWLWWKHFISHMELQHLLLMKPHHQDNSLNHGNKVCTKRNRVPFFKPTVNVVDRNDTIHNFYGFPKPLYQVPLMIISFFLSKCFAFWFFGLFCYLGWSDFSLWWVLLEFQTIWLII